MHEESMNFELQIIAGIPFSKDDSVSCNFKAKALYLQGNLAIILCKINNHIFTCRLVIYQNNMMTSVL
jgi:hypothetical protein